MSERESVPSDFIEDAFGDQAIAVFKDEILPYMDNRNKQFMVALFKQELLKEQDTDQRYYYYTKVIQLLEDREGN